MHNGLGVVVNAAAVVAEPSILFHRVTLGDSWGRSSGSPIVEPFSFVGAGAALLGPIRVGPCAAVSAGSVVTTDVPPLMIAEGVPAVVRPLPIQSICRWFDVAEHDLAAWLASNAPAEPAGGR